MSDRVGGSSHSPTNEPVTTNGDLPTNTVSIGGTTDAQRIRQLIQRRYAHHHTHNTATTNPNISMDSDVSSMGSSVHHTHTTANMSGTVNDPDMLTGLGRNLTNVGTNSTTNTGTSTASNHHVHDTSGNISGGLNRLFSFIFNSNPEQEESKSSQRDTKQESKQDTKSSSYSQNIVRLTSHDDNDVYLFTVGKREFRVSRNELEKIPSLYTTVQHTPQPDTRLQSFRIDGDEDVYEWIFAYASGRRSFLHKLTDKERVLARDLAHHLKMPALVMDLDALLDPSLSQHQSATIEYLCNLVGTVSRIPLLNNHLQNNPVFGKIYKTIITMAEHNNITMERQMAKLITDFATLPEFNGLFTDNSPVRLPSSTVPTYHGPIRPSLATFLLEIARAAI